MEPHQLQEPSALLPSPSIDSNGMPTVQHPAILGGPNMQPSLPVNESYERGEAPLPQESLATPPSTGLLGARPAVTPISSTTNRGGPPKPHPVRTGTASTMVTVL